MSLQTDSWDYTFSMKVGDGSNGFSKVHQDNITADNEKITKVSQVLDFGTNTLPNVVTKITDLLNSETSKTGLQEATGVDFSSFTAVNPSHLSLLNYMRDICDQIIVFLHTKKVATNDFVQYFLSTGKQVANFDLNADKTLAWYRVKQGLEFLRPDLLYDLKVMVNSVTAPTVRTYPDTTFGGLSSDNTKSLVEELIKGIAPVAQMDRATVFYTFKKNTNELNNCLKISGLRNWSLLATEDDNIVKVTFKELKFIRKAYPSNSGTEVNPAVAINTPQTLSNFTILVDLRWIFAPMRNVIGVEKTAKSIQFCNTDNKVGGLDNKVGGLDIFKSIEDTKYEESTLKGAIAHFFNQNFFKDFLEPYNMAPADEIKNYLKRFGQVDRNFDFFYPLMKTLMPLNEAVVKPDFRWLMPGDVAFTCSQPRLAGSNEKNAIFSFSCMLQESGKNDNDAYIDLNVIPDGSNSALVLERGVFGEKMLFKQFSNLGLFSVKPSMIGGNFKRESNYSYINNDELSLEARDYNGSSPKVKKHGVLLEVNEYSVKLNLINVEYKKDVDGRFEDAVSVFLNQEYEITFAELSGTLKVEIIEKRFTINPQFPNIKKHKFDLIEFKGEAMNSSIGIHLFKVFAGVVDTIIVNKVIPTYITKSDNSYNQVLPQYDRLNILPGIDQAEIDLGNDPAYNRINISQIEDRDVVSFQNEIRRQKVSREMTIGYSGKKGDNNNWNIPVRCTVTVSVVGLWKEKNCIVLKGTFEYNKSQIELFDYIYIGNLDRIGKSYSSRERFNKRGRRRRSSFTFDGDDYKREVQCEDAILFLYSGFESFDDNCWHDMEQKMENIDFDKLAFFSILGNTIKSALFRLRLKYKFADVQEQSNQALERLRHQINENLPENYSSLFDRINDETNRIIKKSQGFSWAQYFAYEFLAKGIMTSGISEIVINNLLNNIAVSQSTDEFRSNHKQIEDIRRDRILSTDTNSTFKKLEKLQASWDLPGIGVNYSVNTIVLDNAFLIAYD